MASPNDVPIARHISERFCPNTGVPVRLGKVWPPRLMVHDVCSKGRARVNEAIASVFVQHELRRDVEIVVRPANAPAHDPKGHPIPGLSVGRTARVIDTPRRWERLPMTIQWTPELQTRLLGLAWVRKGLLIELKQGGLTRIFHWYVYLTADRPELPRHASMYDDHPHYNWVTHEGAPLRLEGVSERWIELPAPMSSPALKPACWIQRRRLREGPPGPETLEVLPVFPLEPALPVGGEVAGWNGALGGHDRRPMFVPLSVRSEPGDGERWTTGLEYWDTPLGDQPPVQATVDAEIEPPTWCVWPRVVSTDTSVIQLHQFRDSSSGACEVKLNFHVRLPDDAEPIEVSGARVLLGSEVVGRWVGGPMELYAGRDFSLPCIVDQNRLARAGSERLRLTVAFQGRPSRGICATVQQFRTEEGPFVQVRRVRYDPRSGRRPWLVIDHGTEGTCATLAFFDGFKPRVLNVQFAEGPIHPSRVYIAPGQGGAWTLTDQPTEDALYTTGIKLGLRYGDGAHPGCPDHVSAIEVARFYLKRFLLDLKERSAWFPLEDADVLVSFPPRLACMPRFVKSLRETFLDVVPEVLWPDGRHRRIRFREEAFLVAMPSLYKDLQNASPNRRTRLYWVMDFGGGTTDICGFLCTSDMDGEEQTISNFTYPQRFPHHLSGNDITAAFYRTLRLHLLYAGVVAGGQQRAERQFAFPEDPFPSTRSTHTALLNQTALRELADLTKCTPVAAQHTLTIRDLAKSLRSTAVCSVDDVTTTLVSLLGIEAASLGRRTVAQLHEDVLDPGGSQVTAGGAEPRVTSHSESETTVIPCAACMTEHVLPMWVFSTSRAFRFRCRNCGLAQQVRGGETHGNHFDGGDRSPTILAWQDHGGEAEGPLLLKQDHQNYKVGNWTTLRRWVEERRVGPDDKVSQTGVTWDRLCDRPELADLFDDVHPQATTKQELVDTALTPPQREREPLPWAHEESGLGVEIERFLTGCSEALSEVRERLPAQARDAEVIVLLAGRGSLFQPIADGVHRHMPGRVLHLTQEWVSRNYGNTGTIDPGAGLKTLTANGGGLFALNQTHADTSHLMLAFHTDVLDCSTYLDIGGPQPYWLTRTLGLREGHVEATVEPGTPVPPGGQPPIPDGQPLAGEVRLQVEGLPQDRSWEPWVTVARGVIERVEGQRVRTTQGMVLETHGDHFTLEGLSQDTNAHLENLLPRLELLGED